METFGLVWAAPVAAPLVAPAVAQTAGFIGLALTTVGSVLGIKAAVEAARPKPPQLPASEPVAFEPWGDDPYEEPAPTMAPLAELDWPSPAPPPAPVPVPPAPEIVDTNADPQAPLTNQFVQTPQPQPPGTSGRLGGYYWTLFDWNQEGIDARTRLQFKNTYSPWVTPKWDVISYEVKEVITAGTLTYKPRIRLLLGDTTKYLWEPDIELQALPKTTSYTATIDLFLDGPQEWEKYSIDRIAELTETNRLTRTYVPTTIPQPEPEPLITKSELVLDPLPEVDTEPVKAPPVPITPVIPTPVKTPVMPPDRILLPLKPEQLPVLDSQGRPVYIQRPTVTAPATHVVETPGGTISLPGATAKPSMASIAKEVARIEGKSAQLLKNTNGDGSIWDRLPELILLLQGLADLFEQPLPAKEYSLSGVCEEPLEDGRQPTTTVILPPEKWAERLIRQSEVVPDLLQAHLGYKTPVCTPERPPLEGDWITTRWLSDEKMDHSGRRLRKLFRYRSKSARDLGQLASYWQDFSWQAGPVCVKHTGSWWGSPQVWAATSEEGKRVLRFAAAEAGLDPDQAGQWEVSGSRSPRYGMSGTMRIHMHKGFPWVASRDGADWPNYLAKEA